MLNDNERESILLKVQKLMKLSKHNSNENEAAAAAAKAQEMLFAYNLSMEEIDDLSVSKRDEEFTRQYTKTTDGIHEVRWKVMLAFGVAKANLCTTVHMGSSKQMCWLGKPSNIEVAQYIYHTLVTDLEFIADEKWKKILALRKLEATNPDINLFTDSSLRTVNGKTWKKSFFIGAVEVVCQRLNENLKDMRVNNDNINALIVVNDGALEAYKTEQFPRLGKYRADNGNVNWAGYNSGKAAGREIQFRSGVGSGGSLAPKMIK